MMNSPAIYAESNGTLGDQDDILYPCKGCNEILEEGKAFELAGNRWHIDCFRCTSCNTLLDSDANLLLLGDGSLICNNCTYSCSTCGDKIEDLAILTGDQSFCASCFCCRNCKNKIENLRYARTTQGIFCMACYETLTQKRRKNRTKQKQGGSTLNKALPEPPRSEPAPAVFSPDMSISTASPPLDRAFEEQPASQMTRSKPATSTPTLSERSVSERSNVAPSSRVVSDPDSITLPASTYQGTSTPKTASFPRPLFDQGDESGDLFVPLLLDTNPPAAASPLPNGRDSTPQHPQQNFQPPAHSRPSRDFLSSSNNQSSRSSSVERKPVASPHVALQEKSRQSAEAMPPPFSRRPGTAGQSPAVSPYTSLQQDFMLQDAPKKKSIGAGGSPKGSPTEPTFDAALLREQNRPLQQVERPRRGDSLGAGMSVQRKMVPNAVANGGLAISKPMESPTTTGEDDFTSPRHAPYPPPPHLEDTQEGGVLRKMSIAMRGHTRSVSDRVIPSPRSQRSHASKSPMYGSVDLSSPTSPASREEFLRAQLSRAHQRIADLEASKSAAQTHLDVMEKEVKEKRSTIVVLDAQKELTIRELEVMVDHLRKAKESSNSFDMHSFQADVLRDLLASVNELRQSVTAEIEELVQNRNELNGEITQLIQVKDKGLQEYESLSNRNAQLVQHNNELIQNLHMMSGQKPGANGLGLYMAGKDKTESPPGELGLMHDSSTTLATFGDSETAVIQTPHLVKMKQQKPTLRKGGIGNALRGLKGAFGSERDRQPDGMPYSPMEATPGTVRAIDLRQDREPKHKFGGFFSSDKSNLKTGRPVGRLDQKPMTPVPGQLMDGDLTSRCEFEGVPIPALVTRCVSEIQSRGMNEEGLYRKSGGKTQINELAAGFEQSTDYDLSDANIEIPSVTSLLKQYFRHLSDPLITFALYGDFVDSAKIDNPEERARAMRRIVDNLPIHHRNCLEFIIFHLIRVLDHEAQTKMNVWNLAIVWAPTILRPASLEQELLDLKWQRESIRNLIEQAKDVFEPAA